MLRPIDPLGPMEPTDRAALVRRAGKVAPLRRRDRETPHDHADDDEPGTDDRHARDIDADAGTYDDHGRLTDDPSNSQPHDAPPIRHIDLSA